MPEKVRTQADSRRNQNLFDQYGRKYTVAIDIKIDEPTGAIIEAGWDDPLRTPRHLFRYVRDEYGRPMFNVQMVRWLDEQRQAQREWDRRYSWFKRHSPRTASETEIIEGAGEAPWPPVKALELAVGGSKGLLGLAPLTKKELEVLEISAEEAEARGLKVETKKSAQGQTATVGA